MDVRFREKSGRAADITKDLPATPCRRGSRLDRVATQHEEPYDWRRQVRGVAMARQDDPPTKIAELPLTAFELPIWLVEPAVRSCRLFNTALDFIFYDVPTLRAALAWSAWTAAFVQRLRELGW